MNQSLLLIIIIWLPVVLKRSESMQTSLFLLIIVYASVAFWKIQRNPGLGWDSAGMNECVGSLCRPSTPTNCVCRAQRVPAGVGRLASSAPAAIEEFKLVL